MEDRTHTGLLEEGRRIGRYLAGRTPDEDLIRRYEQAAGLLLAGEVPPTDRAAAAYALRHPRSLPFLDAACAILRPHSLLRSKVLLMTALLEASPKHVDLFVPNAVSVVRFLFELAFYGTRAFLTLFIGLLIYPLAVRRR